MDRIQGKYNRALRYYHLTKNGLAATTCVKALDQLSTLEEHHTDDTLVVLHLQLSILYINIASTALSTTATTTLISKSAKQLGLPNTSVTSMEQFCLAIWVRLYKDGHCDPRLVSAYLLMTLKLEVPTIGRKVAKVWLSSSDPVPDYSQVVKIYATRILPDCHDLDLARSFVKTHLILSDENKETFLHLIQLEEDKHIRLRKKEEQKRQMILDKKRQQVARESQGRRKREAILRRQQRQIESSTKEVTEPETPVSDQGLTTIKLWIHHLKVTGSVTIMVVFFALLGLLKGPRGYLTESLREIMTKIWQISRMSTKVNHT